MTDRTVSLVDSVNNNTVELPVLEPVLGRPCIDINALSPPAACATAR